MTGIVQSGPPFDITAGSDLYGTTQFNGRPGIATDSNKPGLIQTRYGLLDPNPTLGEPLLSRNFGRGPGQISVNLRVAKTIGFGANHEGAGADSRPGPGGGAQLPQRVRGAAASPRPVRPRADGRRRMGHRDGGGAVPAEVYDPDADAWTARQLLVVPPPVAAVNTAFAEVGVRKTEA